MLYYLLLLAAGALQGVMVSLNAQLGKYYSLFAICFFVHGIALILLLAFLLAKKTDLRFRGAPWYVYLVGVLGIAIVASSSWCTLRVGASVMLAISTADRPVWTVRHAGAEVPRQAAAGLCAACRGRRARRAGHVIHAGGNDMLVYYIAAFVNGFFNSVNKMMNVKAGQCFGTAKGSLINYVEATLLSLALVCMTASPSELSPAHVFSVPAWVYLGAVCGLVAMVLIIVGTLHTHVLVSSILALVGNLGMALVLDYVFYGVFSWLRVAGILLILLGITWIEKSKTSQKEVSN